MVVNCLKETSYIKESKFSRKQRESTENKALKHKNRNKNEKPEEYKKVKKKREEI